MAHRTKPDSKGKRGAKVPLTLHKPTGQYRKRIRGKDYYFSGTRKGFAMVGTGLLPLPFALGFLGLIVVIALTGPELSR